MALCVMVSVSTATQQIHLGYEVGSGQGHEGEYHRRQEVRPQTVLELRLSPIKRNSP
jgi:hypothetical protein